ncbi:class F sortase [Paenibacillus faecis]|uniref:class F sortase n=1 Tax=Paenibacillus faecis TaxID=862114 RepID=UPI001BCB0FC8|nr:class F sortase [Paenibacillus faecis]
MKEGSPLFLSMKRIPIKLPALCLIIISILFCSACQDKGKDQNLAEVKEPQVRLQRKSGPIKNRQDIHVETIQPFTPTQLIIPAIKVSAKVIPVGVLDNGQMDVPKDTESVGILYPGVVAGERGNMVMDGHVDSYTGPAVFFNLKKLSPGDAIIVRNQHSDQSMTYRVESVEAFKTSEAPIERVFGPSSGYKLNLITCTGRYSRKKKEHEERLVIFAKLDGVK